MLPSKGYFKSLNCPYFDNGFCDRPHCHFRHTRKDKAAEEGPQPEDDDQSMETSNAVPGESNSDGSWSSSQQSNSSVSYKPTPIVELKKRHIPINIAPCVTISSTSQKRRIEYDVKGVKKPKVEYIPEAVNNESNSSNVYPTNNTSTIYRATKISDYSDQLPNRVDNHENALLQDNEESEGEIDFDQVSNELNFLDEILKEYEKPVSISKMVKEAGIQGKEELEQINNEVLKDRVNNGIIKNNQISSDITNNSLSSESSHACSSDKKEHNDSDEKIKSSNSDSKPKILDNGPTNTETQKPRRKSSSSSTSCIETENKSNEHKRKSVEYHKSDRDKNKNKEGTENVQSLSKSSKREQEGESSFDKLLKSESHKSSSSSKKSEGEHRSRSNKTSNNKKDAEHKSIPNKSTRKESDRESSSNKESTKRSDRESSSNKSSTKESDHKKSSSKSSKKESDHHSKSSKSSRSDHHESNRKRTDSLESHNSSKKPKEDPKTEQKQSDRKKISKHKDESSHRKETNEKRSTKVDNHKENPIREKSYQESRKRTHSVSESEDSSDDDVEIISEHESIIVIDSEEDTHSENSISSKKGTVEKIESSPSPPRSSGIHSPVFPSDWSDRSDEEDNDQENVIQEQTNSNTTNRQDDASLLDHRVQSRIKNRVSLGNAWRPPTRKPVEIMTPAQRLLLFAKLRDQEEKDESQAGRVKIGCVPNVKLLLQEKERLLKGSNRNSNIKEKIPSSTTLSRSAVATQNENEDKDVVPTAPILSKHPKNRGADIYARRTMLEKLYNCQKQLLEPYKPFKYAKEKCLQEESKIWLATTHDTYEKEMHNLIMQRKAEIPSFTLRYFRSIRPPRDVLFPPELQNKTENGKEPTSSTEVSLYSWFLRYILSEEQLESEGYPRKKPDLPKGKIVAYINKESLKKWKKAQGVPPTGEFACANCSKFYAVDENGLSTSRWDCQYHAKKAWRSSKEKSGLLEKKARCCGNAISNPCMTSEFHSTETRDLQNLEGFVETKEPHGEMPPEGWGIYALDCEMYWSTRGQELGRVTVVNADKRTVYDTFVKPEFPVTDYCTRMSGITKDHLDRATKTFTQVQNDLMLLFNSQTILIGHSLENDLKALQIIHNVVVDTAMIFKNGDYKQALKTLASEILKEVIQNEEDGHDSAEDAVTCIKLMVHKVIKDAVAAARKAPPAYRGRYRASHSGV